MNLQRSALLTSDLVEPEQDENVREAFDAVQPWDKLIVEVYF